MTSSYAPHLGGVEEHVRQVARELIGTGCAVEVWTVDRATGTRVRQVEGVTVRDLPTPLPTSSPGGIARFLRDVPGAWRQWSNAYRSFTPDLVHVHCFGPNGAYALALHLRFRSPLIVTSHGETVADDHAVFDRSAVLRTSLRRALSVASAVSAPSDFVLEDLRSRFGLFGGEVVPNGVDLALTGDATQSPVEGRYLLAVGRLGWVKGFDLLIDAMDGLHLDEGIRLVIVGEGSERSRLEGNIASRGMGDRIVLAGRLDPAGVADAMAGALAVIVPSRTEAFGIVALEAWRSGAALVMTERGGAPGFIVDGVDALLVDPLDVDALRSAIARIVADDALRARLVQAGRARVNEFTWEHVASAYLAQYGRVLQERASGDRRSAAR